MGRGIRAAVKRVSALTDGLSVGCQDILRVCVQRGGRGALQKRRGWGGEPGVGEEWGISVVGCPVLGHCFPVSAIGQSSSDLLSSM